MATGFRGWQLVDHHSRAAPGSAQGFNTYSGTVTSASGSILYRISTPVRICDISGARNLFRLLLIIPALCGLNSALRNWHATSAR